MFDGYHHMWGMHWGWWIFWLVVIAVVVWVVGRRQAASGPSSPPPRETALDVLQRRYAAGEISTEEYEERRARLEDRS